jgi:hypothetical protein
VKSKYERRFLHDFRETPAVPAGHNYSHDSLFPLSILIGPLHDVLCEKERFCLPFLTFLGAEWVWEDING